MSRTHVKAHFLASSHVSFPVRCSIEHFQLLFLRLTVDRPCFFPLFSCLRARSPAEMTVVTVAQTPAGAFPCALQLQDGWALSPDAAGLRCQPQPEPGFSHQVLSKTQRAHCAEQRRRPSAARPRSAIHRGLRPKPNCFLNPLETRR